MTETELIERLEKLERSNRRLKSLGMAALGLAVALGLVAATRPIPNVIRAHEFEMVDNAGKVRIRMAVSPLVPSASAGADISLFDGTGRKGEDLNVNKFGGGIYLLDSRGNFTATFEHSTDNMTYSQGQGWQNAGSENEITLAQPADPAKPGTALGIDMEVNGAGEPSVIMYDPQGFKMALGRTSTQNSATGETQQTSADSIVMFGNDKKGHVIWQAP
jgi:hypothetical protein